MGLANEIDEEDGGQRAPEEVRRGGFSAIARTYSWPTTKRMPSTISRPSPRIRGPECGAVTDTSARLMPASAAAEAAKLIASTINAAGALAISMSSPATPGPDNLHAGAAQLELAVAIDELLAADQRREVAGGGDVEEDGEEPVEERHGVELFECPSRPSTSPARTAARPSARSRLRRAVVACALGGR